jgi:uncharacterized membrane protein
MVIMALDHVRDFIHRSAMTASPTDLATTTPFLFVTRWVTHFCAPMFILTAGIGAFLWWQRGRTRTQLSVFLLTRGLWLVVLELTVMRIAYNFDVAQGYPVLLLVLWVLGLCMVGMSLLVWVPPTLLGALSVVTIALHNSLDGIKASDLGAFAWLWYLVHEVGAFTVANVPVVIGYPLVPWIAVMALGFSLGPVFQLEKLARQRRLVTMGVVATMGFVAVRALNMYGDNVPWAAQGSIVFTVMSFLNTTKYPPSVAFLLMTLGPGLVALAWFDRLEPAAVNPLVTFGRVPLLYFVAHFYAAHAAAVLLAFLRYGPAASSFLFQPFPSMGGPRSEFPSAFGYDLWVVYLVWAGVVLCVYPACRWFAAVKARRHDWWLTYL